MRTTSIVLVICLSTTSLGYLPADINFDGTVNFNDLATFADQWLLTKGLNEPNLVGFGVADYFVVASDSPARMKIKADYVCDGIDDQVEIQAAINALPSHGGIVRLSAGRFIINSTIYLRSNLTLRGAGVGSHTATRGTSIYLTSGSNCDVLKYHKTVTGSSPDFIVLSELQVYGNSSNNTSGNGITFSAISGGNPMDILIDHVWVLNVKENGFNFVSDDNYKCWGVYMRSCLSESCGGRGVSARVKQFHFTGGFIAYNGQEGLALLSAEKASLVDVHVRRNHGHGFHVSCSNDITMLGCIAWENGAAEGLKYDNFYVENSDHLVFSGCISLDTTGKTRNGYYLIDSKGILVGCDSHGCDTGLRVAPDLCADVLVGINRITGRNTDFIGIAGGIYTIGNRVGIGGPPETSAALEVDSTSGAVLLPRMTTAERNDLMPVNGMIIYNTTTNRIEAYENGEWVDL